MGGSESKIAFKEEVFRLASDQNKRFDDSLWPKLYQLPESADDVFSLWSLNDIHALTLNGPNNKPASGSQAVPKKNLETLILTCIARLKAVATGSIGNVSSPEVTQEVLNCIRILTRIVPCVYEAEHLNEWEEKFFWTKRRPHEISGVFFDGLDPDTRFETTDAEKEIDKPLGHTLIDIAIALMFFPGFSLPGRSSKADKQGYKAQYHIWSSGIGSRQSSGMTKEHERNVVEIVQLLIALCSKHLYLPPNYAALLNGQAIEYMTTGCDRQIVLTLLCSLLNVVLKYNPSAWQVPIDVSPLAESKTSLPNISIQLLLLLLVSQNSNNEFRKNLGKLHRVEDFQFIQQGLMVVFTHPSSGVTAYLPANRKYVPWTAECLILFWELLMVNKRFRAFLIETDRAQDFVVMLLFYSMTFRDDPERQSMLRACFLILETLSREPHFGKRLNRSFAHPESLPTILRIQNFKGSYADFLIATIHTLILSSQGKLDPMIMVLVAILHNVMPDAEKIERATSSKIMELFVRFSSPKFLLENENNHTVLEVLLDGIDGLLENPSANPRFVEVIVRSRQRLYALRDWTVDSALEELDRQAQERKDRASSTGLNSASRNGSIDSNRNNVSSRSASLGNVPENGTFTIGDDDDEDEAEELSNDVRASTSSGTEEVSLVNSTRSLSEKARGKQPVGATSLSRTTSRNTSNTSLPALLPTHYNPSQPFTVTRPWLEQWLPHLRLNGILTAIEAALSSAREQKRAAPVPTTTAQHAAGDSSPVPPSTTKLAGDTRVSPLSDTSSREQVRRDASQDRSSRPKVQAFQWSALSLGWYLSVLWGLIYASDTAMHKGINGIWTGTGIRLFTIASRANSISLVNPKGAVDAVGNTIIQRLGSLSFTSSPTQTTREV